MSKNLNAQVVPWPIQSNLELSVLQPSPRYFAEDQEWLEQVARCVRQNIPNSHFTIGQLANAVALSERQLRRRLKSLLGLRPWQYVQLVRLERARQLIHEKRFKTMSRLATEVGYRDVDSFCEVFRQYFGVLPKDYVLSSDEM